MKRVSDLWRSLKDGMLRVRRSALRAAFRKALVLLLVLMAGSAAWFFFPQDVSEFGTVREKWVPSDAYLLDRNGEVIDRQRVDFRVRRAEWTPLEAVSPALIAAIVDGEDRRFWQHSGVDWIALLGAIRDNGAAQRRRG